MGECCSTSKLADESQNQVELFEVVPIGSSIQRNQHQRSGHFERRGQLKGQNDLQTEIQEQKSDDEGSLYKERRVIWNEYPLSLYNSQVNSPILTNRSSFNNTLPMRESLTGRVQDPIFISSELKVPEASRVPSTAKRTVHSFVDIAGYDTAAQTSTFMCNSTRLNLETNFSPTETVETSQQGAGPSRMLSNKEGGMRRGEARGEEKKRGGGFLFRSQAEGGVLMATKSDRNSVYVEGTKIGSNIQREESRPRTQSSYVFQNHNSVSSEQMAIEVFS